MQASQIFFNSSARLRSGWRASIYILVVLVLSLVSGAFLKGLNYLTQSLGLETPWIVGLLEVLSWVVLFGVAVLAGWGCGRLLEDLPWRALGWSFHNGAARDIFIGCSVGAVSILIAAFIAALFGGLRFKVLESGATFAIGRTLLVAGFIFILAAAAEEAVFRGYALQTFTRAGLFWVGALVTSLPFALVHLGNPNVVVGFTVANTALAGIWLSVAYLRTRSLWFPLGIHWAWNWIMAAILGIPVSGITEMTPNPLIHSTDLGPAWLTGGAYGLEGGAACTVALVISILFVWRTKLISPTDDMLSLTSHEISKVEHVDPAYSNPPPVSI